MNFLRAQPDGKAKRVGVLKGAQHDLRVFQWHLGLAESHAAGVFQGQHFGERFTLEAARQCAQGIKPRGALGLGAKSQHLDQARFIEHRVCVWRANHTGDAACYGSRQLAGQHAGVFVTRLAQSNGEIHQTGHHDTAGGVDGSIR